MCSRPQFLARGFLLGLALAALTTARAARNDAIVISAVAGRDYVRPLNADGKPKPETYSFMEGGYHGSATADASERLSFDAITRILAANLIRQNYVPTPDTKAAQLLIRVYWGSTLIHEDPRKELTMDSLNASLSQYRSDAAASSQSPIAIADPGRVNEVTMGQGLEQASAEAAIERNAILLGYKRSLDKLGGRIIATTDEEALRGELSEERYFVVLMAYDYEYLRQTKKARLLWVSRLSIRSPGNNFTEALPALALAGAESYGRNVDDLQRVKVRNLPGGEVKMPEMKVLGTEEKVSDAAAK